MELHFKFRLVPFRYANTTVIFGDEARVFGENHSSFSFYGTQKISLFYDNIIGMLDSENPFFYLLYVEEILFGVALPSQSNQMEDLEYFLLHEGTSKMKHSLTLEELNCYMLDWYHQFEPSLLRSLLQ